MLFWALDDPEGSCDDDDVMTFWMDGHVRSSSWYLQRNFQGKASKSGMRIFVA